MKRGAIRRPARLLGVVHVERQHALAVPLVALEEEGGLVGGDAQERGELRGGNARRGEGGGEGRREERKQQCREEAEQGESAV